MQRILIIDDEASIRDLLSDFLGSKGYDVEVAPDGETGIVMLKEGNYDLFILDLTMPGMNGLDVLKAANTEKINIPSIVITAHATVNTAVEAMKLGAFDYITKPFNIEDLYITVKRLLEYFHLQLENIQLRKEIKKKYEFKNIIGRSPQMQKVIKFIEKIADTDSTILVTGESGTGKELVSKTIHYHSPRARKLFVPLNCAAIPKDILESELFGHEKGAFTGAVNARIGRFEHADHGTLFLDEIGELPPSMQVKLLRVLQEKEFERVGGLKTIKVDVRIIAATNRDLEKEVAEGRFREDLFYRLNVIPLHLPPLRNMKEDIPLLTKFFLKDIAVRKQRKEPVIPKETMEYLLNYQWPGNVRELENLIERLIVLTDEPVITKEDLPERIFKNNSIKGKDTNGDKLSSEGVDLNQMLGEIENNMILQALDISKGVKSKAAGLLGLNRTTLIEKMKKKSLS